VGRLAGLIALLAAACQADRVRADLTEMPTNPLGRWLEVRGPGRRPVGYRLEVDGEEVERWSEATAPGTRLAVLGLPDDREASVVPLWGAREGRPLRIAPPREAPGPLIEVLLDVPERREPGYTLFNVEPTDGSEGGLALLDPDARLAAWLPLSPGIGDVDPLPDGRLVGLSGGDLAFFDWCGQVVSRVGPSPAAKPWVPLPDGLHHEVLPLPDGSFVSLSKRRTEVPAYPDDYNDPTPAGPAKILDPLVVQLSRQGEVLQQIALSEVLDPTRIGFDALTEKDGAFDWAHANGVALAPNGDWVVSLRHQDALVALSPTGALSWIVGPPGGWVSPWREVLLPPQSPFFHQHAPEFDEAGDLWIFDNGNRGRTPYDPPAEPGPSRGLAMRLTEDRAFTVHALPSSSTGPLRSLALGDADPLPGGTALLVYGLVDDGARLVEVDPVDGAVVWDVEVGRPAGLVRVYRAERVPDPFAGDPATVCY
jgi:hypothetical protein